MKKNLFNFIIFTTIIFIGIINVNVHALDFEAAVVYAYDKDGNELNYHPKQAGGPEAYLNLGNDYENSTWTLSFVSNYDYSSIKSIETNIGTFTFKEKKVNENKTEIHSDTGDYEYTYTSKITIDEIKDKVGENILEFTLTDENGNKEKFKSFVYFYNVNLNANSNLKVNDTYLIKDGKIVKETIYNPDSSSAVYWENSNTLLLGANEGIEYKPDIFYTNMGSDFNILISSNVSYNVTSEDLETGVKLDANGADLPKTVELAVDKMSDGEVFDKITTVFENEATNFYVYNISLKNGAVTFQPNGKIKISLSVPEDFDTSKAVVYRVTDDLEKIEYKPTVEIIGNIKYVTFETDHFSTYVLAEKIDKKEPEKVPTQQPAKPSTPTNPSTDSTSSNNNYSSNNAQTGTIDVIMYSAVALVSLLGIIGILVNKKKFN